MRDAYSHAHIEHAKAARYRQEQHRMCGYYYKQKHSLALKALTRDCSSSWKDLDHSPSLYCVSDIVPPAVAILTTLATLQYTGAWRCGVDNMGGKYDDYDWEDLPEAAQKAAAVLGYTQKIWDKDQTTDCEDKDWDELTPEEQAAAKVLGYSQKKWDK